MKDALESFTMIRDSLLMNYWEKTIPSQCRNEIVSSSFKCSNSIEVFPQHLLRKSFYKTVSVPVSGISSQRPIKIGLLRFKNLENSADWDETGQIFVRIQN